LSDVSVTLIAGNFVTVCTASVKELCELSFDAATDSTVKGVVATYAAYASGSLGVAVSENMAGSVHTYSGIYGTGRELSQYFGYVRYDVIGQRLILGAPKNENARITVTYLFGSEELTYTFEPGQAELAIPIFRLNATSEIRAVFTSSEGVYGCSFNLFDVYAFAKEGTSARTFLGTLLAYYEAATVDNK
jgi:hypothetical protein